MQRPSGPAVKEQVVDKIPKRFKELKFGIQYALPALMRCIAHMLTVQVDSRYREPGSFGGF